MKRLKKALPVLALFLVLGSGAFAAQKKCDLDEMDPKLCKKTQADCDLADGSPGKCEQLAAGCTCKKSAASDVAIVLLAGFGLVYMVNRRKTLGTDRA